MLAMLSTEARKRLDGSREASIPVERSAQVTLLIHGSEVVRHSDTSTFKVAIVVLVI
jgi:hypothetical protein